MISIISKHFFNKSRGIVNLLAFTLAEVLIVIGIIGIVAQVTLPGLVEGYQKEVYVVRLRQFYSTWNQGIRVYMVNKGCYNLTCTGIFDGDYNSTSWENDMIAAMQEIFKTVKTCKGSTNGTQCQKFPIKLGGGGVESYHQFYDGIAFVTANNFLIGIKDFQSTNCEFYSTNTSGSKLKNACSTIQVDINNEGGPNTYGRDIFSFWITNDGGLVPAAGKDKGMGGDYNSPGAGTTDYASSSYYWKNTPSYCGTAGVSTMASTVVGNACEARIIEENNWKMDY